jgi:MFS transporter, SP family, sugar:H+ symporter
MIPNYPALLVGRAIGGMPIGFAANFAITYWSEAAPAELRGMAVILYQVFINVASFIGACVDQGTHEWTTRWSYWAPLLVTMIFPVFLLMSIWFIPETPRKQ